jgi:hypothetical protein
MRSLFLSAFAAILLAGSAGPSRAEPDAEAILAKAIKAHGGAEALAKYPAVRLRLKVVLEGNDATPRDWEWLFAAPNKLRDTREGYYLGRRTASVTVTNGKKTWFLQGGRAQPVERKLAEAHQDHAHLMQVLRLVPLRDKAYELKTAGEIKVDGKSAVGLLVRTKGQRDITLFFDKESGLLAKVEWRTIDMGVLEEVKEERYYRDYPEKEPMPMARKVFVTHDGKKYLTVDVREVKFFEKLDESNFRQR